MTVYPSAIDGYSSLPLVVDLVSPVRANDVNRIRNTIIAIEAELGVNPSGTFGTVKDRLENLDLIIGEYPLTTKGDIFTYDGTASAKLAVGPDGYTIVANSFTTTGLKWVPPLADGTTGAVQFNSDGYLDSNGSRFYWDNSNYRLGINNSTPIYTLDVTGTVGVSGVARFSDNVGISIAPTSGLHVNSSFALSNVSKTSSYTATASDHSLFCDATSGNLTITLPSATGCAGRVYVIKKIDSGANLVTIGCSGSETIDGASNYQLSSQYESITMQSNGSNWYII